MLVACCREVRAIDSKFVAKVQHKKSPESVSPFVGFLGSFGPGTRSVCGLERTGTLKSPLGQDTPKNISLADF